MRSVCLVGAGKISPMHADALALLPGVEVSAVCDTDIVNARSLAERHRIRHVFTSLEDAIASTAFNFAHVLVPPDQHVSIARKLVDSQIGVLVEKPMGLSKADCETLVRVARETGVQVGVNHNSVFYPAYLKLREAVMTRAFGPLKHLIIVSTRPAHWLERPRHWMFKHPTNLAYEEAVHPLSQIHDLAGPALRVGTTVSGRHELPSGHHYFDTWQVSLECERATAQLFFSYGEYPTFQLVAICTDGVITAEVAQNRFATLDRTRWGRTRWGRSHEPLHITASVVTHELGNGLRNFLCEAGSTLHVFPRRDAYFTSMRDSIRSFHCGPSHGQPNVDGDFGTQVVAMCDAVTQGVANDHPRPRSPARPRPLGPCDAVVLGGTGFIGTILVEQMLAAGMVVRVVARNTGGLAALFDRPEIQLFQGDVSDAGSLSVAVKDARAVVDLMPSGPAELIAEACIRHAVGRLVWIGSIASLDLGDPSATITGSTPSDPRAGGHDPAQRHKARSEDLLLRSAGAESLSLCILRPGLVLGAGAIPFHPGFGIWRGETHCVGWNRGTNPLPLVLASDVAAAIRLALDCEVRVARSYNLVGDVRLSARDCVGELREALQRPLVFHPAHPAQHHALQVSKWAANRLLRRPKAPFPSYRSVESNGCLAGFDCSDVKADIGWNPVADRGEFIDQGLRVHGRQA